MILDTGDYIMLGVILGYIGLGIMAFRYTLKNKEA